MLRKILTYSALSLIACGGFFASISEEIGFVEIGGLSVYAEGEKPTPAATDAPCEGINCVARALNTVFQVATIIVTPAIVLASWLLSPDWTSGDLFGLRDTMYKLWVTISNIIYFVYAILLIMIALGTIFGNEKFGYKVMLPRLALGILMVPFTWVFVQWTISVATYVTASVVSIPQDILGESTKAESFLQYKIPNDIRITSKDLNGLEDGKTPSTVDCKATPEKCTSIDEFIRKGGGIYGNLLIYAYGVFKIDAIQNTPGALSTITSIGQLVNQLVIGILMFLVFGVLVIALIFMLMMRVIKLWVYAIFSPLFTLHFVAGKDLLGDQLDDFSIKEFIGLCFVPAVVGLALSFGLVVITSIMSPIEGSLQKGCTDTKCTLTLFGNPDNKIVTEIKDAADNKQMIETIVTIGGINLTFTGEAHDKQSGIFTGAKNGLSALGGILGTIIVDIIALIFIWVAFMAAKNVSKAVGKAVEPFEAMGKKIGDLGTKLPQYTPIPGLGLSAKGLEKGVDKVSTNFIDQRNAVTEKRLEELIPGINKGSISNDERIAMRKAIENDLTGQTKIREALEPFASVMADGKTSAGNISMMREHMDQFVKKIEGFGIKDETTFARVMLEQKIVANSTDAKRVANLFYNKGTETEQQEGAKALGRMMSSGSSGGANTADTNGATAGEAIDFTKLVIDENSTAASIAAAIKATNSGKDLTNITEEAIKNILPDAKKDLAKEVIEILKK